MNALYAGLDTGSRSCYYWIRDQAGDLKAKKRIPTNEERITSWVSSMEEPLHVHLEASTLAGHIRYLIKPHCQEVVVSDPRTNELISRNARKGDPKDAEILANLLCSGFYNEVWYPDDKRRWSFRQLVLHYDMFEKITAAMKNRIHSRYLMNGIYDRSDLYDPDRKQQLLDQIDYPMIPDVVGQLYESAEQLEEQKQEALDRMWSYAQQFDEINRFVDVPGVAEVVASRFSAYVGNPHRFDNVKQLRSYAKLGITSESSDERPLGYERLDRQGRSALKNATYIACTSAISGDNAIARKYRESLKETGDKTKARLNTQRKILEILWTIWRKEECYKPERVTNYRAG